MADAVSTLKNIKVGGLSHKETGIALSTGVGAFVAYTYGIDKLPQWFGIWTNLGLGVIALVIASFIELPFLSPMIIGAAVVFIADGIFDVWAQYGGFV